MDRRTFFRSALGMAVALLVAPVIADRPIKMIRLKGKTVRMRFMLDAVGQDWDGTYRPIRALSYDGRAFRNE